QAAAQKGKTDQGRAASEDGLETDVDWQALRAVKGAKRTQVWEEELTTAEGWQTDMRTHFAGIFAKMPAEQVKQGVEVIWDQLQRACKRVRWRPFSKEELILSTQTWAKGKSTGPDGISYEALRLLLQHHCWEATLLEEFNDALYKGRSPPNTKKSITVLLPRARRTIRICREWDIPIHVAKVDTSSDKLGDAGWAWEARLWVDLVSNATAYHKPTAYGKGLRTLRSYSPLWLETS
ncbi:unnamed protein product, partial [Symbiodinium pilosum]